MHNQPNRKKTETYDKEAKGIQRYQRFRQKSEDRQDHGQQNKMKDKHRTHDTTLTNKAGVTITLQKPW